MNQTIQKIVDTFEAEIHELLKGQVIDLLIYGSSVTGDFVLGKGDIDFIVFVKGEISEVSQGDIYRLHENYRKYDTGFKQLEGTYYVLNEANKIDGGVYVGTSRKGWKSIKSNIHGPIEQGMILQNNITSRGQIHIEDYFKKDDQAIFAEIKDLITNFKNQVENIKQMDFIIYAIQACARSLYTLEKKTFTTKTKGIEYVMDNPIMQPYRPYLQKVKSIRYPYELDLEGAITLEIMGKILLVLIEQVENIYAKENEAHQYII